MTATERPNARAVAGEPREAIMASCRVEADESSAVVRLTGVLDAAGAEAVRLALLTRLADRPGPVVADVTGLRVVDPTGRGVFAEVRREVADWPAADLLLCDPAVDRPDHTDAALPAEPTTVAGEPAVTGMVAGEPAVTGMVAGEPAVPTTVAGSATVAGVPAWPTVDGALAAVAATPLAAVLTADLAPAVGAARQARELVTAGCRRWGVPTLIDPACIAITEMVNNVVAHARTPMTVRLAPRDSSLHLAVRDHSSHLPTFAGLSPPDRAGGRGLLLIDTVARRWGSSPVGDGKVVWCVLHPEDEVAHRD
ncbi:STAS domain-containing protein [Micromonospora taraxaci]|uniref:Histidine kinase-like protein n=1 Tax=Micromonospora taraxaci TaxID=1316803 RepID=A0A561VWF4_9ACTN|nr:ATP-binding protein [Micromonospora taraxaci]TWG15931.1 histidine kinase-like protein [Micromonospora taraxaci]